MQCRQSGALKSAASAVVLVTFKDSFGQLAEHIERYTDQCRFKRELLLSSEHKLKLLR